VSLSPAQVQILVNIEPFRAAMTRLVEAITATGPQLQRLAETFERLQRTERIRHVHQQYRRKSRGHRL
jgi:hypothetical protein